MAAPLTYGSLFAGVGGLDQGFDAAGLVCRWQVEIDPQCRLVLHRHWPAVPQLSDVRDCGAHNLAPVDVIGFGSPCQGLSVAGRRKGLDDARSGLFFEAVRIIRELRPTWAVWENVPGALSSARGRDFGAALDALADAGAVDLCWRVLDAQWFGVAQRRRRVFLVASFRAGADCAQVLFEPGGGARDTAPRRQARQDAARSLTAGAGRSRGAGQLDSMTFVPAVSRALTAHPDRQDGTVDTFLAAPFPGHHAVAIPLLEVGARTNGDGDRDGDGIGQPGDPMYTLQATKQHGVAAPAPLILDEQNAAAVPAVGALTSGLASNRGFAVAHAYPIQDARELAKDQHGLGVGAAGEPMYTLDAASQHAVAHALTAEGHDASEDGTGRGTPLVPVAWSREVAAALTGNYGKQPDNSDTAQGPNLIAFTSKDAGGDATVDLAPTLRAMPHDRSHANGGGQVAVACHLTQIPVSDPAVSPALSTGGVGGCATAGVAYSRAVRGRDQGQEWELGDPEVGNALRAGDGGSSRGNWALTPQLAVRRLTPTERCRLMGWQDDWNAWGVDAAGQRVDLADSVRYRQCGNGIVAPVAAWLGARLLAAHDPQEVTP